MLHISDLQTVANRTKFVDDSSCENCAGLTAVIAGSKWQQIKQLCGLTET